MRKGDYATQQRVKRDGRYRRPRKRNREKFMVPVILVFIVLIFVGGMGYFKFIKHPVHKKLSPKGAPSNQQQLLSKPVARWRYVERLENPPDGEEAAIKPKPPQKKEGLPNGSVAKEKPKAPTLNAANYRVNYGTFRSKEVTEQLRAELALLGVETTIRMNGAQYSLVGCEQYRTRAEAEQAIKQIPKDQFEWQCSTCEVIKT